MSINISITQKYWSNRESDNADVSRSAQTDSRNAPFDQLLHQPQQPAGAPGNGQPAPESPRDTTSSADASTSSEQDAAAHTDSNAALPSAAKHVSTSNSAADSDAPDEPEDHRDEPASSGNENAAAVLTPAEAKPAEAGDGPLPEAGSEQFVRDGNPITQSGATPDNTEPGGGTSAKKIAAKPNEPTSQPELAGSVATDGAVRDASAAVAETGQNGHAEEPPKNEPGLVASADRKAVTRAKKSAQRNAAHAAKPPETDAAKGHEPAAPTLSTNGPSASGAERNGAADLTIAQPDGGAEGAATRGPQNGRQAATNPIVGTGRRVLSDQLFSPHANHASDSETVSQADQMRLVQRVARAIRVAPQQGGTLRLRLRPPELGALHLEVTIDKGHLSAHLQTENATARHVLLESLPQLRDRLAELGVQIEQFQIDVGQQDSGQMRDHSHEQVTRHADAPKDNKPGALTGEAEKETRPVRPIVLAPGEVNVII